MQKNIKWFILFLVIVVCIVFFWPGPSYHETDILIPVDPGTIPSGLTITDFPLKDIEVRVRGLKSAVESVRDLKLRYLADLSGISAGVNSIQVNLDNIRLPEGVLIIKINPSVFTINVDKEIYKKVPITITFSGKLPSSFFIADAIVKPSSIILRGPEKTLHTMENVMTKPVDINGVTESFKKEIALDLDKYIDIVFPSGIIQAEIFIKEKMATKKIYKIPVKGKNTRYAYSISPPTIDIEIKGPVNILEKLKTKNDIKVYVDLKGLKPGVYVRSAAIILPVKTTLAGVKPEIFTVKIVQ